jgi:hypothetical protein
LNGPQDLKAAISIPISRYIYAVLPKIIYFSIQFSSKNNLLIGRLFLDDLDKQRERIPLAIVGLGILYGLNIDFQLGN